MLRLEMTHDGVFGQQEGHLEEQDQRPISLPRLKTETSFSEHAFV